MGTHSGGDDVNLASALSSRHRGNKVSKSISSLKESKNIYSNHQSNNNKNGAFVQRVNASADGRQRKTRNIKFSVTKNICRHLLHSDKLTAAMLLICYFMWVTLTFFLSRNMHNKGKNHHRNRFSLHPRRVRRLNYQIPILMSFDSTATMRLMGSNDTRKAAPFVEFSGGSPSPNKQPNYGSLKIRGMPSNSRSWRKGRQIKSEAIQKHPGRLIPMKDKEFDDDKFNFDDDRFRKKLDKSHTTCKQFPWHKLYHPTCNLFHEFPLLDFYVGSHGYFRDAWMPTEESLEQDAVLKSLRFKHKYGANSFENVRKDALVMERLTASPRIANIYGHCGTSVTTERFYEELEEFIVPGEGLIDPKDLHDTDDVKPQNNFTATEKLEMALHMAESLADMHGFEDGIIVHDDVQLCQWLKTADGTMKLNDFNRAEVMLWDESKQTYCKYKNGGGYGQYRAPEEFDNKPLDEKIDIFSLGNNIYGLLTGLWNFYAYEDDAAIQKMIIKGDTAYVDERYETRSYAEGALVKIMKRCWEYEPEDRPDIFEVVTFLRNAFEENKKHKSSDKPNLRANARNATKVINTTS